MANFTVFAVGAGHSAKAPGASGCGLQEHVEARKIAKELIKALRARGYEVTDTTSDARNRDAVLIEQVAKCNAVKAGDKQLNLVVHLNASNGQGTGTEVYCWDCESQPLAAKISASIAKTLDVKDRSAKISKSLYIIRKSVATTLLVEVAFIDNPSDMAKLAGKHKAVAEAIADVLVGKPSGSKDSSTASSTQSTGQTAYTGNSIVDYLASLGLDSSFPSRAKLAVDYKVVDSASQYKGTARENTALLAAMRKDAGQ